MRKVVRVALYSIGAVAMVIAAVFLPLCFGTRPLTDDERAFAFTMFGESIAYDEVRIKEGGPLTWHYRGVTIGNVISYPKGKYDATTPGGQALMVHELGHVWQYQHIGWTYIPRALREQLTEPNAYDIHYDAEKTFLEYDIEEQAELIAEYFSNQTPEYASYVEWVKSQ